MAEQSVRTVSGEVLTASADIGANLFVVFEATNGVALPDAAGDATQIVGITRELYDDSEVDAGNASPVVAVGLIDGAKHEVVAGEELEVGDIVIAGNNGKAMVSTATAGTNITAGSYQELGVVTIAGDADEIATIWTFRGSVVAAS